MLGVMDFRHAIAKWVCQHEGGSRDRPSEFCFAEELPLMSPKIVLLLVLSGLTMTPLTMTPRTFADDFQLTLRSQRKSPGISGQFARISTETAWSAGETAVIVCDVWDKHHCLNAVRRMEEFLPRMNDVLKKAREQGATIIHSPSDCMPAYEGHPARARAIETPAAANLPQDAAFWCSKIPAEEQAVYPIDQSDGGEDDDPAEHAKWAAELKALGRNPGLPWKTQSSLIDIDQDGDFISDRGDEVWNILEARGIKNVILVGVHTNMCVLGRPFGLRQMARNGKNVVLMRDLTDCMYNPRRWPYVDHFTGNDLIISHVERYVCPTVTSDQIVGGQPFLSEYDQRAERDVIGIEAAAADPQKLRQHWTTGTTGLTWKQFSQGRIGSVEETVWCRCSVRLPSSWLTEKSLILVNPSGSDAIQAWVNGTQLSPAENGSMMIPVELLVPDDINLLVVRTDPKAAQKQLTAATAIQAGAKTLELKGRWQFRLGDDPQWSNIPLPAKFGLGSDVLFEAE